MSSGIGRRSAALFAGCAALLAILAFASSAAAVYEPVGGGATKLVLSGPFMSTLRANHVRLRGTEGAQVHGATVTFPVSEGKFDPTDASGAVLHEGALVLSAAGRSIPMRALMLKTTRRSSPFSTKLGGSQLKLSSSAKLSSARNGFGEKVSITALKLSAKVATRLGKKLRLPKAFAAGQPLGQSMTRIEPETIALENTGKVSLSFSPGISAKLQGLFVAINPIFPAEHPNVFTLPIFGGTLAPDASQGTIETKGSLELLQLGAGQVFWHESWLELTAKQLSSELEVDPSPPFAGKAGRQPAGGLSLTGATVTANPAARTVTVANAPLTLQPGMAQTFNDAFAKPQGQANVFAAGESLGTVSFTAQGQ